MQKKKHFDGLSPKNAKIKLREIFEKECQSITLNRANKKFLADYNIGLLAICETWHRLRSQNKAVEFMVLSFAETMSRKNKEKHALCGTIHDQRLRLAQLEKENRDFKLTNKTADGG